MPDEISYDARVYRTEVYKGREVTTYHVRWKVGGKLWREGLPDRSASRQLPQCPADRRPQG
jgi:hypothetical protein